MSLHQSVVEVVIEMCLGVPVRISKISGNLAEIEVEGVKREASIELLDNVRVGDFVILHAGFAIQKLDEKEAEKTLELLNKLR